MKIRFNKSSIIFNSPAKVDVLVFDEYSEKNLQKTILKDLNYSILPRRRKFFYISFKIIIYFFLNLDLQILKKLRLGNNLLGFLKQCFYISYLKAWIKCVMPKVVITFIDNDWYFQYLDKNNKNIKFITIQNGIRLKSNLKDPYGENSIPMSKIYHSNFFCFGLSQKFFYKKFQHEVKNIFPVGSLKLSQYLEQKQIIKRRKFNYLLLISQWDINIMKNNIYPEIKSAMNLLNKYLSLFLKHHNFKLKIAWRTNNYMERLYFKSYFNNITNLLDKKTEFSSYYLLNDAKLILTIHSTLGWEAYSLGKKVIFTNFTKSDQYYIPINKSCYMEFVSYNIFKKKILSLINETDFSFKRRTYNSRIWLMKTSKISKKLTHNLIKNYISNLINK